MKAHQFIEDYIMVDEEGNDMFLNVLWQSDDPEAVSYTHLTLPTILRV